jgi:alpha-glucosidase
LRDPYGIRFWPAFKGRDGCRTPMVWEARKPNGGFSTAKPWLPVPKAHLRRAVSGQQRDKSSVLAHYRELLAFRRAHPALVGGDIAFLDAEGDVLAFTRSSGEEKLLCLFNFTPKAAKWKLPAGMRVRELIESRGVSLSRTTVSLDGLSSCFARIG